MRFFELVRNIGFEDAPDYIALRTLLAEMFSDNGYQNDFQYDWIIKANEVPKKNRYHSLNQQRRKELQQPKNNNKGRNESSDQHKKKDFKKTQTKFQKNRNPNDRDQGYRPHNKDNKFYKTHEGFHNKQNQYKKDKSYEYDNKNERGYDAKQNTHKHFPKNNREGKNHPKNHWKNNKQDRQEHERGEEVKKQNINPQTNQENKKIFAHQMKNIHKLIAPASMPG